MNLLKIAEKAFSIVVGVAGAAVKAARGAIESRSDGGDPEQSPPERGTEHAPPERRPAKPERRPAPAKPSITDGALADKVESVLFSDPSVPKGKIDINAVGRDVYLRGEARTPDMIKTLERRAKAIPEVARVENLLHLPKTPAPTRADTPKRAQKTRRTKGTGPARKRAPKKVNAESKASVGETPKDLAAKGEGRKPAPMGSTEKDNGSSPRAAEGRGNETSSPEPNEDVGA